jgi:hypothetical protein
MKEKSKEELLQQNDMFNLMSCILVSLFYVITTVEGQIMLCLNIWVNTRAHDPPPPENSNGGQGQMTTFMANQETARDFERSWSIGWWGGGDKNPPDSISHHRLKKRGLLGGCTVCHLAVCHTAVCHMAVHMSYSTEHWDFKIAVS